jgi:Xaa-Pro aminopeptidase
MDHTRRLGDLRAEITRRGLAAYVVPKSDEYMLEYAPACSERLAWLTGFTGSAGLAIVGREAAALFVDGRYTQQAAQQTPAPLWEHHHLLQAPPAAWLRRMLSPGDRVGYDPRIHTPTSLAGLRTAVETARAALTPVETNLVDLVWPDRPPEPATPVELYPEALAGEPSSSKRGRMAAQLTQEQVDVLLVSAPDSLAWLLNIRGGDIENTPLSLGRALLGKNGSLVLFMDRTKLDPDVVSNLEALLPETFSLAAPESLGAALAGLGGKRVRVDQASASEWMIEQLKAGGATLDVGPDPCTLAKAQKTSTELQAIQQAHIRDGAAVVSFLSWFAEAAPGDEDEWSVAQKLATYRQRGENYRGPSFHTISAVGPSSALPHYRASRDSALPLSAGSIYLVDSGGQYLDGTTDITRVTIIGNATDEMRRRYTQVLKGHIALSRAQFPTGTTGHQLDPFARQFLWQDGVDFDHGTGHGVGCYLSVHEGPHGISKRPSDVPLRPGMIVSNEPGYYKPGAFGIRIENLIAVVEVRPQPRGAEKTTLGFETLTVVPYERRLIEVGMLTAEELAFVDAYHARVRALLLPLVDPSVAEYLREATTRLAE